MSTGAHVASRRPGSSRRSAARCLRPAGCGSPAVRAQVLDRRVAEQERSGARRNWIAISVTRLRQALAGAQVERHVGPAPVVDRRASARRRSRCSSPGPRLVSAAVGRHALARRCVPAPYWPRTVRRQHVLGASSGWIACSTLTFSSRTASASNEIGGSMAISADELEQVVRHHVAQRAGLCRSSRRASRRHRLGHGDLHVIDVAAVPDRLEDAVGEAEHQDVLHRLLAQVVIDAIDLPLAQTLR